VVRCELRQMGDRDRGRSRVVGSREAGSKKGSSGEGKKKVRAGREKGGVRAAGRAKASGAARDRGGKEGGRARVAVSDRGKDGGSHWLLSTVLLLLLFVLLYVMWAGWPEEQGEEGRSSVWGKKGVVEVGAGAVVLIDAGHGGQDGGTVGHGMIEKNEVLLMAKELKAELELLGITSDLTRAEDQYLRLEERWLQANQGRYELFVSLHLNGSEDPGIHGIETFYSEPKSPEAESLGKRRHGGVGLAAERGRILAERVQELLVLETGARDRGAKNSKLAVVYRSASPAILIEAGFLTNRREAGELAKDSYRSAVVRAIARGIDEWRRGELLPPTDEQGEIALPVIEGGG